MGRYLVELYLPKGAAGDVASATARARAAAEAEDEDMPIRCAASLARSLAA